MSLEVKDKKCPSNCYVYYSYSFFFVFFSNSAIGACTYERHMNAAFSQGRERFVSGEILNTQRLIKLFMAF